MILALALAVAMPVEAAERAFAAQAQREGQWTAFRTTAAPDAVMFDPEMVRTHDLLAGKADPPAAVMWWPARTITSCDGTLALSTGPWTTRTGKAQGTFTTVWQRQAGGGWKWLYDSGRQTPAKVSAGAAVIHADPGCSRLPRRSPDQSDVVAEGRLTLTAAAPDLLVQFDDAMPLVGARADVPAIPARRLLGGESPDHSLRWQVDAIDSAAQGAHMLRVWRWTGRTLALALIDVVGVKAP